MRWLTLLLLTSCVSGMTSIPIEQGSIAVFFCDQVDCEHLLLAENIEGCAMYNTGTLGAMLVDQDVQLVVDGEHRVKGAVSERGEGLMHNKFCVLGGKVWTGSWNPSQRMTLPNNAVIVQSPTITAAYQAELDELLSGVFHGGRKGSANAIVNGSLIEAFFCPEDGCKDAVIKVLKGAQKSVHFMTYSFTDDDIGKLVEQKAREGLDVRGVFDPRKESHSEYERLAALSRITKVHHKVFIVDGQILVTGSYNPTRNGDEQNDENVLIIHDERVAELFEQEFERLWNESQKTDVE
ncbi:hypothetical protein HY489_02525 [Candidatus Woesearchaeota archaeon]|nr:hypothetical protein [Candidatus Woesearchaeota archaeon]